MGERVAAREPRPMRGVASAAGRPAMVGEIAWIAVVPCAVLTILVGLLLGPPLGDIFFDPGPASEFWPGALRRPEPTEHARYVIALLGPLLLCGIVAVAARRRVRASSAWAIAVGGVEVVLLACVAFAFVAQHTLTYRSGIFVLYPPRMYFTWATVAVAALIAIALAAFLRQRALVERLETRAAETPAVRRVAFALAALFVGLWLLSAFNTDGSLGRAALAVQGNIPLWLDEAFSILNGLAPLAGFHAQYAQLWPYLPAGAMAVFGASFGVYAAVLLAITAVVMLAVYATLRRVVHSSLAALALFAPFVATSFFLEEGTLDNRYTPANLFTMFPLRYGGPYLLAWLVCRHLDGASPRRWWPLMLAATLVLINNPEFGLPGFVATCGALAWSSTAPLRTRVAALARAAAIGGLAAVLAVAAVTLTVAGRLPHFEQLLEYPRIYGMNGFSMAPMPTLGIHLAIYLTFAAALVVATVRAVARERDVVLTGMLCWSGVFGLGAGAYFAGRSHPYVLIDLFSAWAFALVLLVVAVVRAVLARPTRRLSAAELTVLFGFGLAVCSLAQAPVPWRQVARIGRTTAAPRFEPRATERFLARRAVMGEHVAILGRLGHRAAYDVGVVDVAPYADLESMVARRQWRSAIAGFVADDVHKVFLEESSNFAAQRAMLEAAGYARADTDRASTLTLFVRGG
ncbi:MAG TPA: hypothetical protein VFG31_02210 [Conexibacter sp.]|nr:hypothetical protein [Conexibacter sp.]